MREKIAEIVCPDCQDKKEDGSCIWKNCSMYDKKQAIEALFTAETAALREEIKNLESTIDGLMNGGKV